MSEKPVAMDGIFRNFVIDASHRLRTPLTKVQGYAETARDLAATDPVAAAAALEVIGRGAAEMRGVIDDLLAAARNRFAAAATSAPATDALAVLRQALVAAGSLLRARGVTVRLVTFPEGPIPVPVGHGRQALDRGQLQAEAGGHPSAPVRIGQKKQGALAQLDAGQGAGQVGDDVAHEVVPVQVV